MKRKRLYGILLITFLMILVMLCKEVDYLALRLIGTINMSYLPVFFSFISINWYDVIFASSSVGSRNEFVSSVLLRTV